MKRFWYHVPDSMYDKSKAGYTYEKRSIREPGSGMLVRGYHRIHLLEELVCWRGSALAPRVIPLHEGRVVRKAARLIYFRLDTLKLDRCSYTKASTMNSFD